MSKYLVVYFSHKGEYYFQGEYRDLKVGNTEIVANKIQKMLDADIFEITTVKEYPYSYKECCDEALYEQKNNIHPELTRFLPSLDEYSTIVLAYPCWWSTIPMPVFTFLDHYDFSNKHIKPICTHEGSGLAKSVDDIKNCCLTAIVEEGLAIKGSDVYECDKILEDWFNK